MNINPPSDPNDCRTGIESAVANQLIALAQNVLTRNNTPEEFQQVRPAYWIDAIIGAANNHRIRRPTSGVFVPDQWNFTLKVKVLTSPENDGQSALHAQMISYIKEFLYNLAQSSWGDLVNWPLHLIAECLKDTGSNQLLKAEEGYEFTDIQFSGVVMIRPGTQF